ncbi:MAG TPA: hypothetical protein VFA27_08265 [Vicinamibacterales bacterium]|nr:hypothetical protein [Vicinamibacterales bacterium]
MTRTKWALFALLFVSYAYFYQAGGWNQNSRFALVRAITKEHSPIIDPYHLSTGDKSFDHGHYYSDKAPGIALAAVPFVAAARPIARAFGVDTEGYAGVAFLSYVATVFTAGLVTAIAGVALYTLCVELGASEAGALFAAIVFGLGTPIWTLATIFIGHAFSASLLLIAFAEACRVGDGDWRHGALAGVCAGWATVSEFPAAIPAVVIALLVAAGARSLDRGRALRLVGALTASALAAAAVLMIFQYVCFGSPFHLAYSSEQGYVGMQHGIFGVEIPKLVRLRRILFGEYRGLLPLAPILTVAPFGLVFVRRRLVAAAAFAIAVYYILLNASYVYWEGGWSYGPRHASPAIPFLCIGVAMLWTRAPRLGRAALAIVGAYGVALTLVAVSTAPLPPNNIRRPVAELLWPAFVDGDLALNPQTFVSGGANPDFRAHTEPKAAFNLGMKMGLRGLTSLLPLMLAWAGCAAELRGPSRAR